MEPRNYQSQIGRAGYADASIDMGLRSYMLQVYNYMAIGLVITGVVAYGTYLLALNSPAFQQVLFQSPLRWAIMFGPLALLIFMSFRIDRLSASTAQMLFWTISAIIGLSFSSIFMVFTGSSIARTFFVTAASFGALSLYGYTTKRDLSAWGTFLFMGLIGLILASIVNLFMASSALQFAISVAGVLIFAGFTAYDTQTIKEMYYELDDSEVRGKKAIMGALNLYLDFINLFSFLLNFLGDRE